MKEFLNIINDNDEIIGERSREEIHREGLLHREIHVYFITPDKKMIFQHRAKDKETYPDLLDATVGGHVEIGHSYERTAIKETLEETGVSIDESDLIFISKTRRESHDKITGKINNAMRHSYIYIYGGEIEDLRIEKNKALGFEVWPIEDLLNIDDDNSKKFIPYILEFSKQEIIPYINKNI